MRSDDSECWWNGEANSKRSHSVEGICIDFRGNERKDKVRYPETNVGKLPSNQASKPFKRSNRRTS